MTEPIARLNQALEARYRVEREIGRGGMAVVYLAHDLKHGRPVAIKVLRAELGEAMGPERFTREIEVAAQLNHPNILALYDSGEADGLLYFVMPFIEGDSLRDCLDREGALPLDEALRIVRQVGGALAYAHERGLVHRDIKPENILFQAGHAVVGDFGIAKAISEAKDRLTGTGVAIGTIAYVSPEQATDDGVVDARSDIYSLGCLLHEMLAGEPPFSGSAPPAILAKKLMGAVPELGALRPDVPPTVRDVIRRSLEVAPEDRFATSTLFVRALEHAATEVAVARDARRRRWSRGLRAAAATTMIAALGGAGWWLTSILDAPAYERIAVLPFTNVARNADLDYLVQGVHEDLIRELQRAGVRVINPGSVRRYAEASIREIADDLGVDGVIQGAAGLESQRIGIELLLVDARTEELVWTESFSAAERDVLRLLRTMTRSIADEIGVPLTDAAEARLAEAPGIDPVIYEALLQSRFERRKLTRESLDRAETYAELALARDSTSVEAWVHLGAVWSTRAQQGLVSPQEARENADRALARAADIDPERGLNHAERALRLTWPEWPSAPWLEAEDAFRRALEQDPGDAVTRAYFSLLLLYLGEEEEATEQIERAVEQDPRDVLVQGLYGQALNALHRWDDAVEALNRARAFEPDAPILLSTLRTIYHLTGDHDLAIDMWRDSYRSTGDFEALEALERGFDRGGYAHALRSVAELFVERSATERVTPWQIGTLYTRAGMADEALEYLTIAVEEGDYNSPYLSVDAIFDPLRGDPRFQALIDRLRLPGSDRHGAD